MDWDSVHDTLTPMEQGGNASPERMAIFLPRETSYAWSYATVRRTLWWQEDINLLSIDSMIQALDESVRGIVRATR